MGKTAWRAVVFCPLFAILACSETSAAYVGDYYFPSTLATTVPTAADFYNPPYFVRLPNTAATSEVDIPTTYSKLITPDWAVIATETYRILQQANQTRTGFEDLLVGTQYQLYTDAAHQFVFTVGGTVSIGGTGRTNFAVSSSNLYAESPNVGPPLPVANPFSTFTPTVYVGKGFGDLPDWMAAFRPIGVTAQVGVALPDQSHTLTITRLPSGLAAVTTMVNPDILLWSFALEYSLLTNYSGGDRKGSRFPRGWVPLVEFAFQTPLDGPLEGQVIGTVNPGFVWVDQYFQFAVEGIVPINGVSGRDLGIRAQLHLYLSQIFPDTLGKPIFGK
jgi:hypothetical protein